MLFRRPITWICLFTVMAVMIVAVILLRPQQFEATSNFDNFQSCGRPCWAPVYLHPAVPTEGAAASITDGYPCESYDNSAESKARGPYCSDHTDPVGDKVRVVCQIKGDPSAGNPDLRNSHYGRNGFQHSNLWFKVIIPADRIKRHQDELQAAPHDSGFYGYINRLWLHTGGKRAPWCQT